MTVYALKQLLEDMDDDAEIRYAHQPSWAFEYAIDDCVSVDPCDDDPDADDDASPVVYLVEGNQLGYLPGHAAAEIGW